MSRFFTNMNHHDVCRHDSTVHYIFYDDVHRHDSNELVKGDTERDLSNRVFTFQAYYIGYIIYAKGREMIAQVSFSTACSKITHIHVV